MGRKDDRLAVPVFSASACGYIIDVPAGAPFVLELEENPTTGYRWDFEAEPGLDVLSSTFASAQPGGAGGGGIRQLQLRADGPGQFYLRGRLVRSWVGASSAIKTCDITVRVS
jgi:inhibitor of cysteine peptidase